MTCVTDGMLKTYLDRELSAPEASRVEAHLALCARCRGRADRLEAEGLKINALLNDLAPTPGALPETSAAYARLQARLAQPPPQRAAWMQTVFARRWRPAWAAAAMLGVLAAGLGLRPARSWAQRILAMLRVQKIAVVPVDFDTLKTENPSGRTAKMVMQLISDNVIETLSPGKPVQAADAAEASKAAGFDVRLPSALSGKPSLVVNGETSLQLTLNRSRLQSILTEAGRGDLEIPSNVDGALIAVHFARSVRAAYGPCSKPHKPTVETGQQPVESRQPAATGYEGCTILSQTPSPVVSVPPDLNIAQLAEVALQFGGMTPAEAHQFCQTVDWTSTLVVPVPTGVGDYRTAPVDGVEATVVELHPEMSIGPGYAVVWIKNGIIYSLMGQGSANQGEAVADSLE